MENIEMIEELEMLKELREVVIKEISLKGELYYITDKYPRVLNPEYEYQLKDEFWDKVKEVNVLLHKKELLKIKIEELSRIDELIKMIEKNMKGGEKNGE